MSTARYLIGDTRDLLDTITDGSVDLIVTSPPFLALRSYLPADHPDKHREIGSEATPADFLSTLLALTVEWRRKLAPHGSLCDYRPGLVLDPFAGSGTTLQAATGLGREAIGFDLDPRNADLARERVGMFLEVA